ncbi:MAG TPA: EAL domain-containing protein [Thermodesulfobacteriota bacterium]|nr:EAL domain-containing protein [Thermodesulfobacteriota bacterium]
MLALVLIPCDAQSGVQHQIVNGKGHFVIRELRILLLEDNPADADLIRHELSKASTQFLLRQADTEETYLKELKEFAPDLILSDYTLPSFDGMSALAIAKEKCPEVPFIFVTGSLGEETAIETLKSGATDYVLKDRLSRLVPSIHGALKEVEERGMRKKLEEQLIYNAFHDALTGVPNRNLFLDRLNQLIRHGMRRKDYLFAVLFLDLDRFKKINDSLGHRIGDLLLRAVAQRLEGCLRSNDTVGRLGGDEFTIILDDIKDISDAIRVANRISREVNLPFNLNGHRVFTSASIGVVLSSAGYERTEDILHDADLAMLRAKSLGGGRYEVFDHSMRDMAAKLLELEVDLHQAIERQEFELHYQPVVSLDNGKITGIEALLRWRHPKRGLLLPAEFIPGAEVTRLIIPIGDWVLREACRQARVWQDEFYRKTPFSMNVNLSGKQCTQSNLVDQVEQVLKDTDLDPSKLRLEIIEDAITKNAHCVTGILRQLRALGVRLSLDDFGTGYSSFGSFNNLPVDTLKIDRSFIKGINGDEKDWNIVRAIIMLAHGLGMDVTAEGIETANQLTKLRLMKCTHGQGYYFSKPMDCESTRALIAAQPSW